MQPRHELHHHIQAALDHSTETALPPLHHQWPQLGQELFAQEEVLTEGGDKSQTEGGGRNQIEGGGKGQIEGGDKSQTEGGGKNQTEGGASHAVTIEQEKERRRDLIRRAIMAQLYHDDEGYSLDMRHLAFLLVRLGRGGELVGSPSVVELGGSEQELPYTGLEGYYAGSERTSQRPGMTSEDIIQEEANLGAELLKSLKKRAIENYSWSELTRLMRALEGQEPTIDELKTLQLLWAEIVRRLHVRIYHNPEFEPTLTENLDRLEHLLFCDTFRTEQEKEVKKILEEEYHRLKDVYDHLSIAEQEQEREKRQRRIRIRADRLEEFHRFRKATYEMLAISGQGRYVVRFQDSSLQDANITEIITLPDLPDRSSYLPTLVHLTPEQLEGYLFLARLGEVGGDPLVRSALVSEYPV